MTQNENSPEGWNREREKAGKWERSARKAPKPVTGIAPAIRNYTEEIRLWREKRAFRRLIVFCDVVIREESEQNVRSELFTGFQIKDEGYEGYGNSRFVVKV
jgi:hypothetical protein